jgi:atypical dual specificity phosphatase
MTGVDIPRPEHCLSLRQWGVAYGDRPVLSRVDLDIPGRGAVVLMGPAGTGKSTLLRTVAGFNRHIPQLSTWGEALYCGRPLGPGSAPVLVSQKTQLLTATLQENLLYGSRERLGATSAQKHARALTVLRTVGLERFLGELSQPVVCLPLAVQRMVAIARAVAGDPALVMLDEPTFGLSPADAQAVLEIVRQQALARAVLVVLHSQAEARTVGGTMALLAGGIIHEIQSTERFFERPQSAAGLDLVATGSCSEPSPGANVEDLDVAAVSRLQRPPDGKPVTSASSGPRGFVWLLPGKLAGTAQPGVVADLQRDLEALRRVGVSDLICLTETAPQAPLLARHGIAAHWFPIPDAHPPGMQQALEICSRIDALLGQGAVVAVHCRAGLGRTGTILVAYLIWLGRTAMDALETGRRFEPRWVQSALQVSFLERFAAEVAKRDTDLSGPRPAMPAGAQSEQSSINPTRTAVSS